MLITGVYGDLTFQVSSDEGYTPEVIEDIVRRIGRGLVETNAELLGQEPSENY